MARLESTAQSKGFGLDLDRSLLVLSANRTFSLYLVGGADFKVDLKENSIATLTEKTIPKKAGPHLSEAEKGAAVRLFELKGVKKGDTVVNFNCPDGKPGIDPLKVVVVQNTEFRQADKTGKVSDELAEELRSLSFRDALIRVATDQMFSAIGRSSSANGTYDDGGEWCGSFVRWCYEVVSKAKNVADPFDSSCSLRSGIKALWAGMHDASKFTVLNYEGPDRYQGLPPQTMIEIGPEHPVERGDVCIWRGSAGDTFPHVSMVYSEEVEAGAFQTVDGNQTGVFDPATNSRSQFCIGINSLDLDKTVKIGKETVPGFVFVHVRDI